MTSGNFFYIRAAEMRIIEDPESQRTKITITPEQYHKSGHKVSLKKRCKQIRYDYATNTLDFAIVTKTPDRFLKHRECFDVYNVLKEFKTLKQESLTQMLDDLGVEITPSIDTLSCQIRICHEGVDDYRNEFYNLRTQAIFNSDTVANINFTNFQIRNVCKIADEWWSYSTYS